MANSIQSEENERYYEKILSASLKLGFVVLLIIFSYLILKPFVIMILWSIIIAVGIYPLFRKLSSALGNRDKLASVVITITALAVIILPSILLLDSSISGARDIVAKYEAGTLVIAAPDEKIAEWPLVGKSIYETWKLASTNIIAAIEKFEPQIKQFAPKIFSAVTGMGGTILLTLISIIIAGVLLTKSQTSGQFTQRLFNFLIGKDGEAFTQLARTTISSVVQGVLGIAALQSVASGIIMLIFGIPAAGLWALLVLVLAITQLPTILILLPVSIYGFSILDTTSAVIFLILSILITISDNILKPIFLGRGVEVPMLVILLGAIGGMLAFGILGLFVGAVILALTYKIFLALINEGSSEGTIS
jgi:predicted PurR-regulated permease PerM